MITAEFGKWDVRKAAESPERDMWLKYIDLLFAQLDDRMKKYSQAMRNVPDAVIETQFVVVMDVAGFSMRQFTSYASTTYVWLIFAFAFGL